jgi:hypothetical protein
MSSFKEIQVSIKKNNYPHKYPPPQAALLNISSCSAQKRKQDCPTF